MRYLCLAAVLLVLPFTATAQERRPGDRRSDARSTDTRHSDNKHSDSHRDDPRPAQLPSNPRIPAWEQKQSPWWENQPPPAWERNPQTTLTLPTLGLQNVTPPMQNTSTLMFEQRKDRAGKHHYPPAILYPLPPYRYFYNSLPTSTEFYPTAPAPTEAVRPLPVGAIRLEVEPRDRLQIFVDGAFAGTPADLDDVLELRPGTHRIELRAAGYRTLIFDVTILQDRLITYRGALDEDKVPEVPRVPDVPRVQEPPVTAGSRTIYVIPGCYVGNVEPKASQLRAGCDLAKLTKILP